MDYNAFLEFIYTRAVTASMLPTSARDGLREDTTVHVRVYWDVQHKLDFVSGVVDFMTCTKKEESVKYYGFTLRGCEAVCKEGYTSAQGFLEHLTQNVNHCIADITTEKTRPLLTNANLDAATVKVPAALAKRIEVSGPEAEIKKLLAEMEMLGYGDITFGFSNLEGMAIFNPKAFAPNSAKLFVHDVGVAIVTSWDITAASLAQLATSSSHPGGDCRRFSLAADTSRSELVCVVESMEAAAACIHWMAIKTQLESLGALLKKTEVHGPRQTIVDMRAKVEASFWEVMHGAFFVPAASGRPPHAGSRKNWGVMKGATCLMHSLRASTRASDAFSVPVAMRGISLQQLKTVNDEARQKFESRNEEWSTRNLYHLNEAIIRPACDESCLPYAVMLNKMDPLAAKTFITHAWAEPFNEFVKSVDSALSIVREEELKNLWICIFAIFQSDSPSKISDQLGSDPSEAPFTAALASANRFLVVRNSSLDIYTRIWCVWELYMAYSWGFLNSEKLMIAGPSAFSPTDCFSLTEAKASSPNDKEQILEAISANDGVADHITFLINLLHQ